MVVFFVLKFNLELARHQPEFWIKTVFDLVTSFPSEFTGSRVGHAVFNNHRFSRDHRQSCVQFQPDDRDATARAAPALNVATAAECGLKGHVPKRALANLVDEFYVGLGLLAQRQHVDRVLIVGVDRDRLVFVCYIF